MANDPQTVELGIGLHIFVGW